jgi:hypothetical protein
MATARPWYAVILLAVITLAAGAAAFYLRAFTSADSTEFMTIAVAGFGAIAGVTIPPVVAAVAAKAAEAPVAASEPDPGTAPADDVHMRSRVAQKAEADAALLNQGEKSDAPTFAVPVNVPNQ